MTKSNVGRNGFLSSYSSQSLMELKAGAQAGPGRQEMKQTLWRTIAYWLAPHGLLSLLSHAIQANLVEMFAQLKVHLHR